MLKKFGIVVLVSLIVGGGVGYLAGSSKDHPGKLEDTSPISTGMHSSSPDAMVQELQSTTGSSRDEAFIEMMIVHHQSAIDMSEILLTSTKRPELERLAEEIIAAQTKEIETMRSWLKEWYGR